MKCRKLLIKISLTIFIVGVLSFAFIASEISDIATENEYGYCSMYDSQYNQHSNWWVCLLFVPLGLIPLAFGIKVKDKDVIIISAVLVLAMIVLGVSELKNTKNYSTSLEDLEEIEQNIAYEFPEGTTILKKSIHKNGLFGRFDDNGADVLSEGIIRLPKDDDFELRINWQDTVDESIQEYFSESFWREASEYEKYFHTVNEDGKMFLLTYYEEKEIIFFCIVDLK